MITNLNQNELNSVSGGFNTSSLLNDIKTFCLENQVSSFFIEIYSRLALPSNEVQQLRDQVQHLEKQMKAGNETTSSLIECMEQCIKNAQ